MDFMKIMANNIGVGLAMMIAANTMAQDIYTRGFPEAMPYISYAIWAVRERAGLRPEYAGESGAACRPGIVVRRASEAEWAAANASPDWQALTAVCPLVGAYQVVWKPGAEPTRSLMLHELGGHAMGCWKHLQADPIESIIGSRHVMASQVMLWAAFTVEDVGCIRGGSFWPIYSAPDTCFVELMDNFDLIAPNSLGRYTRMAFAGSVAARDYVWRLDRRVNGPESDCASVRLVGSQIVLDDVRGPTERYSATLQQEGEEWRLIMAVPL